MAKLIFGCGYLGLRVARAWAAVNETVYAVTRSRDKAAQLAAEGLRPIVHDIMSGAQVPMPQGVGTVLFAVGHERGSPASIVDVYTRGLANVLGSLPDTVGRIVYISSTGVYGKNSGETVDESSVCLPRREGGKACLAAEQLLEGSRFGAKSLILRLAGLYGPGRIPRAGELIAGRPIDAPSQGWLNLIHVEDAAKMVLLAEERAIAPRTFVVSDGHPVSRGDYYMELARLLGAPPPRFAAPDSETPAAQRAMADKRVHPRRMFEELQPTLQFPDFRAGLAAIVCPSKA
jgi:nucleoside-diphosphate-sugar epimerase